MDLGLQGKCAFVAGSSQGLGYATALQLAREGANVAINGRTESTLHQAAEQIRNETESEVLVLPGDVSNPVDLDNIFREIEQQWHRLDILVANAGGPPAGTVNQMQPADYRIAIDLNLQSTIEMVYRSLPLMKKHQWGRIIAITSLTVKEPADNLVLSNTARAGVVTFLKSVANTVAPDGITANVVCPGHFKTERSVNLLRTWAKDAGMDVDAMEAERTAEVPLKRYGDPAELADTITFLASGRAGYITGVALQVDGGLIKGV